MLVIILRQYSTRRYGQHTVYLDGQVTIPARRLKGMGRVFAGLWAAFGISVSYEQISEPWPRHLFYRRISMIAKILLNRGG